ncbi:acyl-CoA dehydrogenase family protein [Gordonia sp. NPDC127522]|uniref:acyl-CoA dehydrogenase family protein n=1 Tax=Gordonia sp. NPDC127522 TaxID=3345390 RepID=UPI00363B0179
MDFALSVEQEDLGEVERAWLEKHDPIRERRRTIDDGPARVPAELRRHVEQSGLTGLLTAEAGGTNVDLLVLTEAHGWAGSPFPLSDLAIGARIVEQAGLVADGGLVLPLLAGGAHELRVDLTSDTIRLQGTFALVPGALDTDEFVVVARADDGREVAVLLRADEVRVRGCDTLDLLRAWSEISVDIEVCTPRWAALPDRTVEAISDQLAVFRAVDALGASDRLLGMSVTYAGQRTQFGRPIGSFQAVKHHLAGMTLTVEAGRSALWAAAAALDDLASPETTAIDAAARDTGARAVSAALAFVGAGAGEVAQLALQVHGGIGFTWEHDVHLFIRRIKTDELTGGPVAVHRRRLVGLPTPG